MKYLLMVIALSLTACTPKPPATLAEVVAMVAANDWDGAEAAVASMKRATTGCDLAKSHALGAGLENSNALASVAEPLPELADLQKARFWQGYENAIASANDLGGCNLRSLSEAELEIGG